MSSIFNYMAGSHKICDELFVNAENQAANSNWVELCTAFQNFLTDIERHFKQEEDILFPAFEEAIGSSAGPTQVMRMEHRQMRELTQSLLNAIAEKDRDSILGDAETLLILMQQHNMKEETMLYPLIDRVLGENSGSLILSMEKL